MSQTICLNMIVKNEAAIIEETLANITDHIKLDYYVISDTGSRARFIMMVGKILHTTAIRL